MNIIKSEVKDLTILQYLQVFRLTMQKAGRMRDILKLYKDREGAMCYLLEDDDTIKSWGIVFEDECHDTRCNCLMYDKGFFRLAFFYTKKSERGKGYGSIIANEIKNDYADQCFVYKVERNKDFFNKNGFNKRYNKGDEDE